MVRLSGVEPPTSGATNLRSEEIGGLPTHRDYPANTAFYQANLLSTLTKHKVLTIGCPLLQLTYSSKKPGNPAFFFLLSTLPKCYGRVMSFDNTLERSLWPHIPLKSPRHG